MPRKRLTQRLTPLPRKKAHLETGSFEVVDVIDKKEYQGDTYYKVKWADRSEPTWQLKSDCNCSYLIKKYEKKVQEKAREDDENEWEVEEILDKRLTKSNKTEYLLRWRNWNGEPTWVREDMCNCINLIAAYENPKLKKMWDFQGNNPRLWVGREPLLKFMRRFARKNELRVNLLVFEPDLPENEKPPLLEEGINIGPLSYRNHWYLIIILVNHISITRQVLIGDPLNTLNGSSSLRHHPVYKRIRGLFDKNFPIKPILMTPMERSDLCAFYVLAAYERALFLYDERG